MESWAKDTAGNVAKATAEFSNQLPTPRLICSDTKRC